MCYGCPHLDVKNAQQNPYLTNQLPLCKRQVHNKTKKLFEIFTNLFSSFFLTIFLAFASTVWTFLL